MARHVRHRAFAQALEAAGIGSLCAICRQAPTRDGPGSVVLYHGNELARCEGCGHYLDGDGRLLGALWADGSVHLTRIVLRGVARPDER